MNTVVATMGQPRTMDGKTMGYEYQPDEQLRVFISVYVTPGQSDKVSSVKISTQTTISNRSEAGISVQHDGIPADEMWRYIEARGNKPATVCCRTHWLQSFWSAPDGFQLSGFDRHQFPVELKGALNDHLKVVLSGTVLAPPLRGEARFNSSGEREVSGLSPNPEFHWEAVKVQNTQVGPDPEWDGMATDYPIR